jgi:hypothetical protein
MKKAGRPACDLDLVFAEQKVLKKTKESAWFLSLEASFHDTANFYFLMVRSFCSVVSVGIIFMPQNLSAALPF